MVQFWDIASSDEFQRLDAHSDTVNEIAVDGSLIASASNDQTARVFDATTCELSLVLRHDESVATVAISGKMIASGTTKGVVRLWHAYTGELTQLWEGASKASPYVRLCGNTLAYFGYGGYGLDPHGPAIRFKNTASTTECPPIRLRDPFLDAGSPFDFLSEGCLVTVNDWGVQLHDLTSKCVPRHFPLQGVRDLHLSPDRRTLGLLLEGGTMELWRNLAEAIPDQDHTGNNDDLPVSCVSFSPDGRFSASGHFSGRVILRNEDQNGITSTEIKLGIEDAIQSLTFSPDGKLLGILSDRDEMKLWDIALSICGYHSRTTAFAFSGDSKVLLTVRRNEMQARIICTGQIIRTIRLPNGFDTILKLPTLFLDTERLNAAAELWKWAARLSQGSIRHSRDNTVTPRNSSEADIRALPSPVLSLSYYGVSRDARLMAVPVLFNFVVQDLTTDEVWDFGQAVGPRSFTTLP